MSNDWLDQSAQWIEAAYKNNLGLDISREGASKIRWVSKSTLTRNARRAEAGALVIEDSDIGWLLFVIPCDVGSLESEVNQALGLRSRLLREYNYSGSSNPGEHEDPDSTWRVGLVWLVDDAQWNEWLQQILRLRRESGVAEEISIDAVRVLNNDVANALDDHGLPRLLLSTRALLNRRAAEAVSWLSADAQVAATLHDFSNEFSQPRAQALARLIEEKANNYSAHTAVSFPERPREFGHFCVENFRNLERLEVSRNADKKAQAIVLFGPNGTGKSSFAEAVSMAAFGSSPRMEQFLDDKSVSRASSISYAAGYLRPFGGQSSQDLTPRYSWGDMPLAPFSLDEAETRRCRYEGVVLNQEDSIRFSELPRETLAAQVLEGYSSLADSLSAWLDGEERQANERKLEFTRKHGLNAAIKLSSTAYERLAASLLSGRLKRPSPEFVDWLKFLGRNGGEQGAEASAIAVDWDVYQTSSVPRIASSLASLRKIGASDTDVARIIQEEIDSYDRLSIRSSSLRNSVLLSHAELREQLDSALEQIDAWGAWLTAQTAEAPAQQGDQQQLKSSIEALSKTRNELEKQGKLLRDRLLLLDRAKEFLNTGWSEKQIDVCPVCDSDVSDRNGIDSVVTTLREETNTLLSELRERFTKAQTDQKQLELKLKSLGMLVCPVAAEDQAKLRSWLAPFLREGQSIEDGLRVLEERNRIKADLARMRRIPDAPTAYADALAESDRIALEFGAIADEADRSLEEPQAISEVKKAFELRLERVMKEYLPATLGKVWQELTLSLTTATWLLPDQPTMQIERRGKSMTLQGENSGKLIRYLYNAAERHVLGLAWFFTYYLARRRFEEAWFLLDDPAQEMDQPSYRELVRLWETLIRVHERKKSPLTMLIALHQEDRALDAARATNGLLYVLGWQREQNDLSVQSSIRRVVLLAPGYHPLKPEKVFA